MTKQTIKATTSAEAFSYAPIVKFEELDNGNLLVFGKATDDTLDSDDQVCDPAWLDRAMPAWFKFGNIREQHSNVAAGVAVEYDRKEDGHYITVEVVDDNSKKKVRAKVLKGFSIGIRRPRVVKDNKAIGGRIVDGDIVEVSLVDRPANPSCVLTVAKSADGGNLVQVEEFLKGETVEQELLTENEVKAESMVEEVVVDKFAALAKAMNDVTLLKYDEAAYLNARSALAQLIAGEAMEFGEGHDERHSLWALLGAVNSLLDWFAGEAAEGEVSGEMEMAIEPDTAKCLDCGCHMPSDNHGRSDVSTAEVGMPKAEDPDEEKMCKECGKAMDDCECKVELAIEPDTDDNTDIKTLVTDLVKSLLTNNESGEMTKATDGSQERITALEAELEKVKSLAVSGGPSRMGAASAKSSVDDLTVRANLLIAKAEQTLDKKLAEGYRLLANDLLKSVSTDK